MLQSVRKDCNTIIYGVSISFQKSNKFCCVKAVKIVKSKDVFEDHISLKVMTSFRQFFKYFSEISSWKRIQRNNCLRIASHLMFLTDFGIIAKSFLGILFLGWSHGLPAHRSKAKVRVRGWEIWGVLWMARIWPKGKELKNLLLKT